MELQPQRICLLETFFKVGELKRFMRKHKETLEEIIILRCTSDLRRFETIQRLFLETDLLLIDFVNLQRLQVDDLHVHQDEQLSMEHMESLYQQSLNDLKNELRTHLALRKTLNVSRGILVIKQLAFDYKLAFEYALHALRKHSKSLTCISFVNILDMKSNAMKAFCEKIRELDKLQELEFVNVLFSDNNILQIRYLLNWRQRDIRRLVFKRAQISDYQLLSLFHSPKFSINDLVSLNEAVFKSYDKQDSSSIFATIRQEFTNILNNKNKTPIVSSSNHLMKIKKFNKENAPDKLSFKQKLFEPKRVILHDALKASRFSAFPRELKQPLKTLLFKLSQSNFCSELDISAFALIGASQDILSYLIKAVCQSKSLHTLRLQNSAELLHQLLIQLRIENNSSAQMPLIKLTGQDNNSNKQLNKKGSLEDNNNSNNKAAIFKEETKTLLQIKTALKPGNFSNDEILLPLRIIQPQSKKSKSNENQELKKRKTLKILQVEGSEHNTFGQKSIQSILELAQFSYQVELNFKDSALNKDGLKGLLEGLETLIRRRENNEEIEMKSFILKNIGSSSQLDIQYWRQLGKKILELKIEELQCINLASKEANFQAFMDGLHSDKRENIIHQTINKIILFKKAECFRSLNVILNEFMSNFALKELRLSCKQDQFQGNISKSFFRYVNNSAHVRSDFRSSANEQNTIFFQDIALIPSRNLLILQISNFINTSWPELLIGIANSYSQLEELNLSENGLTIDFLAQINPITKLKKLKKLIVKDNPLRSSFIQSKIQLFQDQSWILPSGTLLHSSSTKKYQLQQLTFSRQIQKLTQLRLKSQKDLKHSVVLKQQKQPKQTGNIQDKNKITPFLHLERDDSWKKVQQEGDKQQQDNQFIKKEDSTSFNKLPSMVLEHEIFSKPTTEISSIADEIQSLIRREEILHRNVSEGNKIEGLLLNEDKGVNNKLKIKSESVKNHNQQLEEQQTDQKKIMNDFFNILFHMESLREVDLANTGMTLTEVEQIDRIMLSVKSQNGFLNYETINLSGNKDISYSEIFNRKFNITAPSKMLPNGFKQNFIEPSIEQIVNGGNRNFQLNLSKFDLSVTLLGELLQILQQQENQFKVIDLSDNPNIPVSLWSKVINVIFTRQGKYLEKLSIAGCHLEDKHIVEICKSLEFVCQLEEDSIKQKYLYGELALNELDFSRNGNIEKEGWLRLISTLFGQPRISLRSIYLNNCAINDIKAQYILDGLKEANIKLRQSSDICLRCLESIDLAGNPISLSMQIIIQQNFLLCNILQESIPQIQEYQQDTLELLQSIDIKRDQFQKNIQNISVDTSKPSIHSVIIGPWCSKHIEFIIPEILRQFSVIEKLIIHINLENVERFIDALVSLSARKTNENVNFKSFGFHDQDKVEEVIFARVQCLKIVFGEILQTSSNLAQNNEIERQPNEIQQYENEKNKDFAKSPGKSQFSKIRMNQFIQNNEKEIDLDDQQNQSEDQGQQESVLYFKTDEGEQKDTGNEQNDNSCGKSFHSEKDVTEFQNQHEKIAISSQHWKVILEKMKDLCQFKQLELTDCKLNIRSFKDICKIQGIETLNLANNNHLFQGNQNKQNDKVVQQKNEQILLDGFKDLLIKEGFREIILTNTGLNESVMKKIAESIIMIKEIKQKELLDLTLVDISGNQGLSASAWLEFLRTLINHTKIEQLSLRNCGIGKHNVQGVINALLYAENTHHLQQLILSKNPAIYPEEWGKIIVTLFGRFEIKYLDISQCCIYDQKLEFILCNLFQHRLKWLEGFSFNGNQIKQPQNYYKLLHLLFQAPRFKKLSMKNCHIYKRNTEFFSDQINLLSIPQPFSSCSLRSVDFSKNPQIIESYNYSVSFLQSFFENLPHYFLEMAEINLSSCFIDTTKADAFVECINQLSKKGLKIKSLQTLNISHNRFTSLNFASLLPNLASVTTSLQNLYLGHNLPQIIPNQISEFITSNTHIQESINPLQGITFGLLKAEGLKLANFQISDFESVSEEDWEYFLKILFGRHKQSLENLRIEGQPKMPLRESKFFVSLRTILTKQKFINETFSDRQKQNNQINMHIQSVSYCLKEALPKMIVLPWYNWKGFVKNGFQSELESGHILQMSPKEFDELFWKAPQNQATVAVMLHNDISIMKFEQAFYGDSFKHDLKLRADLYIALNILRKHINCQNIDQIDEETIFDHNNLQSFQQSNGHIDSHKSFIKKMSSSSIDSNSIHYGDSYLNDQCDHDGLKKKRKRVFYLNMDYFYPRLPMFIIPEVLTEPLPFRKVDISRTLKGFENLTFEYPLYVFFIQTCNLYPCESIVDFFVKLVKSLSSYYLYAQDDFFSIIQASPSFFLTGKDRDKIQAATKKIPKNRKSISSPQVNYLNNQQTVGYSNPNKAKILHKLKEQCSPNPMQHKLFSIPKQLTLPSAPMKTLDLLTKDIPNTVILNEEGKQSPNKDSKIEKQPSFKIISNDSQAILQTEQKPNVIPSYSSSNGLFSPHEQYGSFTNDKHSQFFKRLFLKDGATKISQRRIYRVLCPYYFSTEIMSGREESDIIERIQKMPPSELEIKGLSISAIKTIYAFCFTNPYFTSCQMDYKLSVFVNTSLAWSLREALYRNHNNSHRSYFRNKCQHLLFESLRWIIQDDVFYKYDNSAIMLNEYYQTSERTLRFLIWLILPYHGITAGLPFIFSDSSGIFWISHLLYCIFALCMFITEAMLVKNTLAKVLHLTPGMYVSGSGSWRDKIKLMIVDQSLIHYKYIIYLWYLICSQFSLFNAYSNWCFLALCLHTKSRNIFMLSFIVLSSNKLLHAYRFLSLCESQRNRLPQKQQLPGYNITQFYQAAIQLDLVAYSEVLNVVSPYNVTKIPNNFLTRLLIPHICGQSINQNIYYQLLRTIFKDIPQIILQISFLSGQFNVLAYASLAITTVSLSLALFKILSIRPSIISQLDFEELKVQKQADHLAVQKKFNQDEQTMLTQINKNFSQSSK